MNSFYLGLDLGSSYTKFAVVDAAGAVIYRQVIPTRSRKLELFQGQVALINSKYDIKLSCATGYGRKSCQSNIQKTELVCASAGLITDPPRHKMILDIGGEDTKIIESGPAGEVLQFHMNDKCSAGTGSFITEIAEKAELEIEEMSELASKSASTRTMNSFCTVFAKSEILGWKFEGVSIEAIARGIYLSIVDRISKMPLKPDLPIYLTGGVVAFHPFLTKLLSEQLGAEVLIAPEPQFVVAVGAAMLARQAG